MRLQIHQLAHSRIHSFYARLDAADQLPFLAYLLPVLVDRTGQQSMGAMDSTTAAHYAHQQEAVEPSEEIRLQMVLLLATIVSRSQGESLAPCVEDMVTVVCRTLADPFPEVKKESCRVVRLLVEACPRQVGMQHTSLCKAIVANVLHKHANVRAATVTVGE